MVSRLRVLGVVVAGLALATGWSGTARSNGDDDNDDGGRGGSRIQRGLAISPVKLNIKRGKRALVGLGSYIVNAQAVCADCHSCPTYAKGGNPFAGEPTKLNTTNYLAGGVPFGPFDSHNITPDTEGKPFGLDFDEFLQIMRTGHEPDEPGEILQVMPWPIFANMTNHDLRAIYEFLKAIPPAQPGSCTGPGEAAQ
jgi:hypothetical protein